MLRRAVAAVLIWLVLAPAGSAQDISAGVLAEETFMNDSVRSALAQDGDDGTVPRHVDHFVYPDSRRSLARRNDVRDFLVASGFGVSDAQTMNGLRFFHTTPVAGARFDRLTAQLRVRLAVFGWAYDGWETVLVR